MSTNSDEALIARSARTIAQGSKSFATAARLFDPATRASAVMLYAWCRHCDDVVDGQVLGHREATTPGGSEAALARLRVETAAAYRGERTDDPVFQAFAAVMRRHAVPEALPLQHLEGFAMDVAGTRYRTFEDTLRYCYHVAGVVGVMMGLVMTVRDPAVLDRASDLGIAFQLTNIARDLVDDARAGRVYLPDDWLASAGLTRDTLADGASRPALAGLAARLVGEAEPYYRSAAVGLRSLPLRSAWAIATALRVYRAIGIELVRAGPAAWDRRVSTSKARKLALVGLGAVQASGLIGARPASRARLFDRPSSAA